jgi:DNA-directed RNA polymerase subunit RPC12/RpoP
MEAPSQKPPPHTFRFSCMHCGQHVQARLQDGGMETECPSCHAPITVPRIPTNPYSRPMNTIVRQMKSVPFTFPYFPQLIQFVVLTLVLCIFALLYVTIGIVSQIAGVFQGLILDAQKQMREGSAVEKSAQAVSIGVYSILLLPFSLIQLPFSLIGSLWSSSRFGTVVVIVMVVGGIYALRAFWPQIAEAANSFITDALH